jgi:ribosomal protein S27AE
VSLTIVVTVHCDRPGCGRWEYTADYSAVDRRKQGWVTKDGAMSRRRDLCPECAAALVAGAEKEGKL